MRIDRHVEPRFGPMCAAKIRREKTSFGRYPWDSAKERGPKGYAFINIQKADFLAVCIVKSPWAQEGTTAYFGKRSGPGLGSWHRGVEI
jgi:hypothetical protein